MGNTTLSQTADVLTIDTIISLTKDIIAKACEEARWNRKKNIMRLFEKMAKLHESETGSSVNGRDLMFIVCIQMFLFHVPLLLLMEVGWDCPE